MSLARDWLNRSKNSEFGLPYTMCVYKPMLELLSYLREEGFKIYTSMTVMRSLRKFCGTSGVVQFLPTATRMGIFSCLNLLINFDDHDKAYDSTSLILDRLLNDPRTIEALESAGIKAEEYIHFVKSIRKGK